MQGTLFNTYNILDNTSLLASSLNLLSTINPRGGGGERWRGGRSRSRLSANQNECLIKYALAISENSNARVQCK